MKFDRHQLPAQMAIDIDGTFHAKIEVETTPDIAIERHVHLRRDRDAGWLIYRDERTRAPSTARNVRMWSRQ